MIFNRKNGVGFTIIELVVAVAIIAILASIIIAGITQYISVAKDSAAKADLNNLVTAGQAYLASTGSYDSWITDVMGFSCAGATDYSNICNALDKAGYGILNPLPSGDSSYVVSCGNGILGTVEGSGCSGAFTNWCAMIKLKASANWYCVDSTGIKNYLPSIPYGCTPIIGVGICQ